MRISGSFGARMNNSPEEGSALSPPAILSASATSDVCSALDAIAASAAHWKAAGPVRVGGARRRSALCPFQSQARATPMCEAPDCARLRLARQCGRPEHAAADL